MESELLLLCAQGPATGHYPEPDEFSQHPHPYFFKTHFNTTLLKNMQVGYKT
jgi:hypothetical protein